MIARRKVDILLSEDSPTDTLLTRAALEDSGIAHTLHTVTNGGDALAFLRREGPFAGAPRPDLVLLDLNLPRVSGHEVLATMKADRQLRYIPVVILTTSSADDDVTRAYGEHANGYIAKPVDLDGLSRALRVLDDYWFDAVLLPPRRALDLLERATVGDARPAPSAPVTALLVEDSPTDALLTREAIGSVDPAVRLVHVGRVGEVQRSVQQLDPDVILLDLGLPDATGLESLRRARTAAPEVPIVVLTGASDERVGQAAVREGAADYLVKGETSGREIVRTVRYAMERRAAQRRALHAQRMEAIGQLAGGIAHDLNNLMTVIGVSLDALAQAREPGDIAALVGEAQGALTRGASLTRQILGLSRRQTLAASLLDVGAVVRGAVGLLRRLLGMVRVDLVEAAALPPVRADAMMLEQVLMNLAINARNAMRGQGTLTVRTRCVRLGADEARAVHEHARSGEFVCVAFEDTGPGVDPAIRARIWDPFFTTRAREGGTGLGLTTVYGIARQHDGWVTLDSPPGRGATFELWLPSAPREVLAREGASARPPPRAAAATPSTAAPDVGAPRSRGQVLIVDDEPAILAVARRVLVAAGWEVECISDGATAIARVDAGLVPTVVVVDLTMPGGLGGVEVAEALAARIPDVPVVFTSGFSDDTRLRGHPIIEGVNFLSKPFTADGLRRFVAVASGRAS